MNKLVQYLHSIHPLSSGLREHLYSVVKTTDVRRRERLLKIGEVCTHIHFIEKGLFRCYYESDSGEVCAWFMKEGDVIVSVGSFFSQAPSYQAILAMEESIVHSITYEELQRIYKRFPEFNLIGRLITEKYYDLCEDRLYSLRMKKAAERYHYFLEGQPEMARRIPATYIASYLGITRETLSRIKKKIEAHR
ncbi:MAG TPA: Crp/Fnr family transcriptional regulator [Puia sp.]|nr:Crp/Fnr family transcriptional regulator [Puia sp.]